MQKRTGGCNCGKVRFQVNGNPIRVGVCHCRLGGRFLETLVKPFDRH
jgi:hypothetical protein